MFQFKNWNGNKWKKLIVCKLEITLSLINFFGNVIKYYNCHWNVLTSDDNHSKTTHVSSVVLKFWVLKLTWQVTLTNK